MNKSQLWKRVLLNALGSRWTSWPFAIGATLLLATWAFRLGLSSLLGFAGFFLTLVSVGMFFSQVASGDKKALEDLRRQAHATREKDLDNLEHRLISDGDPRSEKLLRDLRTLADAFQTGNAWSERLTAYSIMEITSRVAELFDECVNTLKKTLVLYATARALQSAEAKKPILEQREKLIQEVDKSIEKLGSILAGIQSLGAANDSRSKLKEIRDQLDMELDVARRVDEKMADLDGEPDYSLKQGRRRKAGRSQS